jgi:hypothetical protein
MPRTPPVVEAAHAYRRRAEQEAEDAGSGTADRQGEPEGNPGLGGAVDRRIGADRHECRAAERNLPGISDQQVEADGDDDVHQDERQDVVVIVAEEERPNEHGEDGRQHQQRARSQKPQRAFRHA